MIVTEEQAKTKWCPFARVPFGNRTVNGNRGFDGHPDESKALCIGSACMAWRELHPRQTREDHSGASIDMASIASKTNRIVRREGPHGSYGRLVLDAVGYCGLAGKP